MKKILGIVIFIVILMAFTSCTTFRVEAKDGNLIFDPTRHQYRVVGHFDISASSPALIFGLLKLYEPSAEADKFLREQISKYQGDAVRNVNIKDNIEFLDMILYYFTIGIYSPSTVWISGDVIKYE
jgi:hypothetical protein